MTTSFLAAGVLVLLPVSAWSLVPDLSSNPYRAIAERNVFGLQDPPVPPPVDVEPEVNASNVKLTGITKVLGQTRVLMLVQEMGANGKVLPDSKEESYMLSVGQAQGPIEVDEIIDEKEGKVRIKNAGKTMVISFDTHGTKLAAAPPPAATPKIPAPPSASPVGVGRRPGIRNIPEGVPVATPAGIQEFPLRPVRTEQPQSGVQNQYRSPLTGMTVDEEAAAAARIVEIEVNRELTVPEHEGLVPPLPMTPLTPGAPPEITGDY